MAFNNSKPSAFTLREYRYKKKLDLMKETIKRFIYENAALCDQVAEVQESILIAKEEKKFLMRKLTSFEPHYSDSEYHMKSSHSSDHKKNKRRTSDNSDYKPSKPRKSSSKPRRKIALLRLDSSGRPIFPIELGNLAVHSLGEIVDAPEFHDTEMIYPIGYVSTRVYCSMKNPIVKRIYTCKISECGGMPKFEIVADDNEIPIVGMSTNECHAKLLNQINKALKEKVISTNPRGNDFFGLSHPAVLNLIKNLPNAKKCANFRWSKSDGSLTEFASREQEPTLNFDTLQRNITYGQYTKSEIKEEVEDDITEGSNGTLRELLMS